MQTCLKDLNDNKDTYTTIFDNTFLAKLRDIHLATGAVFSLYIFSKGVIDITTMTEKYKEQFTACSHWLKFGIHSPLSDDHYETFSDEDFVASYKEISEQIVRFAGRDCLDNMPRFGFFSANKSGLIALKNAKLGFVGTLSADDERTSNVGLDETERAILISHDSFYDAVNNIYYCRTTERFDSLTTEQESIAQAKPVLFRKPESNSHSIPSSIERSTP